MTIEKLEQAKNLQNRIEECKELLASKEDTYYWCAITVDCGNSNTGTEHHACIPRELWGVMLSALEIETKKLEKELNEL